MSTNILDLENDLKNQNLHGIYVFYGEEKYLQQEYLRKIKKIFGELSLGINYILLDENKIDTLISDIETPAFGYEKKLIIIRDSNLFKKDCKSPMKEKFKKYVSENMDIINEATGSNICRGDKDNDAGYLQDICELIGDYCKKNKLLDFNK